MALGRTLGTLPIEMPLIVGNYLIYAGKRWRIVSVDDRQRVIDLEPARGGKAPLFGGEGVAVSGPVRRAMRTFYGEKELPAFLDGPAKQRVTEGREYFHRFALDRHRIVPSGAKGAYLFLWADDRVNTTLWLELHRRGISSEDEGACLLFESTTPDDLYILLRKIYDDGLPDPLTLAEQVPNTIVEKYDAYLTPELRHYQYAARHIRIDETLSTIREILTAKE